MGKLMGSRVRSLLLCALLLALPSLAAAQCVSQLTIQSVLTQDTGGNNKTTFAPGEPIRFAVQLNNAYGGTLLAAQITITTSFFSNSSSVNIPAGISTWTWNTTVPSQQANYTVTVSAFNQVCGFFVSASVSFTVGQGTVPLPDLSSTAILYDPADLIAGNVVFFDSGVQNSGAQGTGVFNVRWFVDGESVGYGSHAGVPANSTIQDGNSQFSWFATTGTHTITFAVDVDNHVMESNESNNSRSVTVTVETVQSEPSPGWSVLPSGGTTPSGPAAASYNGELNIVVRGGDGGVYHTQNSAGVWTAWTPLGGVTPSEPAAVEFNGELWVFVRGTNNRIYVNRLMESSWSGWAEIPDEGLTPSGPGAAVLNNKLYLFVRGTNNRIYVNLRSGTSWSGWSEVPGGGLTSSRPAAVVLADTLYLAVQGTDTHIYHNLLTPAGWSGWAEIPGGGLTPSGPAAAVLNGELGYFVRGTNDRIYQNRMPIGGSWSGWSEVPGGGLTPSAPGAAATTDTLYVAVRGTDNGIYLNPVSSSRKPEGKAPNLIVLVHGCCTDANGVRNVWDSLGRLIAETIARNQTPEAWEIVVWDWTEDTPRTSDNYVLCPTCLSNDANTAYDNAASQGFLLWSAIAIHPQPYKHVHLIGHSAGAKLIDEAAKLLEEYFKQLQNVERPFIHLTFLDAYTRTKKDSGEEEDSGVRKGYGYLEGYLEHFAEHYVDDGPGDFADATLASAFNFDITGWSSDKDGSEFGHRWPRIWYTRSVESPDKTGELGFKLSLGGGNEAYSTLSQRFEPGKSCHLTNVFSTAICGIKLP